MVPKMQYLPKGKGLAGQPGCILHIAKAQSPGQKEQLALLSTDGMLVKRPILVLGDIVLVGFREAEWEKALKEARQM